MRKMDMDVEDMVGLAAMIVLLVGVLFATVLMGAVTVNYLKSDHTSRVKTDTCLVVPG